MPQQFSSTIQVLKVEKEERVSKRTGNTYSHFAARVILLTDDGDVETVGVIGNRRVTSDLRDSMRVYTFRATFALMVSDFGEDKGDVVCMLPGLVPAQLPGAKQAQSPSALAPATTPGGIR